MTDPEANEDYAEFVRDKIRERVSDPAVAELLVPKDHPFGSKRIPLETGYYEVFNRHNERLVDVRSDPIREVTPADVRTGAETFELDFDTTFTWYRQQLFAALAWWSGTLGQPPDAPAMQPAETSLEFVRRTCVAIDDLDALDSFD